MATCGSVTAVTWNILLFFPLLDPQGLLLWLLELSEGAESRIDVDHLGCNVGVLARHEFEMLHCWLNHTFSVEVSDWRGVMWADFLGSCWSRWADLLCVVALLYPPVGWPCTRASRQELGSNKQSFLLMRLADFWVKTLKKKKKSNFMLLALVQLPTKTIWTASIQ